MFDCKREKQSSHEKSPGGSRIYTYEGNEFGKTEFGVLGEETIKFAELRESLYDSRFGKSETVYHEVLPMIPHVDVYSYEPNKERPFWTLVTSGMSDLPMTLPKDISSDYCRAELIFYCSSPETPLLNLMRTLAHFPHDNKTWLAPGHTMPNGNPPEPIFPNTPDLTTFLFLDPLFNADRSIDLRIDGQPLKFLWLMLISGAECEFKLKRGLDQFLGVLDANNHPFVFQGNRPSYV